MKLFCQVALLISGLATLAGCGSSIAAGPDPATLVAVKGRLTMDNVPMEKAMVIFFPQDTKMGDGASALTDASGNYEMTTGGATGAVPGSYRVIVSRLVDPAGKPVIATPETPPASLGAIESLPRQYSDFTMSKLSAKVAASGGTFDFKLTSK